MEERKNRLRGKYNIGPSGVFEDRDFGTFTPAICKEAADAIDQLEEINRALSLKLMELKKERLDEPLDFGDYCTIEQKRYGVENEHYIYKVIGKLKSNHYRPVPVDSREPHDTFGEMCSVVRVICCGVDERKVETFRLQDVKPYGNKQRG